MDLDLLAARLGLPGPAAALAGATECEVVAFGAAPDGAVLRSRRGPDPAAEARFSFCRSLWAAGVAMPEPRSLHTAPPLVATHWELLDAAGPVDWASAGRALASLHGCGLEVPAALRWEASPSEVLDAADAVDAAGALAPNAVELLLSVWREGAAAWRGAPMVCVHGDAWPRNLVFAPGGARLVDWDSVCAGPAVYDLALVVASAAWWSASPAGGHGPVDLAAFADGYGAPLPGADEARAVARAHEAALALRRAGRGTHGAWVRRTVDRLSS